MGRVRWRLLVLTLLAPLLVGCGTQTIVRTVTAKGTSSAAAVSERTASQASSETTSSAADPSTSASRQASIGDTLGLQGGSGLKMAVTVDAVLDPLSVGPYDQADSGQRFVGVQITLRNVGSVSYSDAPGNGATLLSNTHEQATGEIVTSGPCGNEFQSSANIAPGDVQEGCIPFELPVGEAAGTFQFTLNSGLADQTGQWSLAERNGSAATPSVAETPSPTPATATATATATVAAAAPSTPVQLGPVAALTSYWADIKAHRFGAAFTYLTAHAATQSEPQFVAGEQQAGIHAVSFSGRVASQSGADATVHVSSLITRDEQFGCRSWSGSYQLVSNQGQWQIEKASITPGPCG